jgi:hypothetical protein
MITLITQKTKIKLGRHRTKDAAFGAFLGRMPSGFAGDVTRFQTARIEPTLVDAAAVLPLLPGTPVVVDATTQGVRALTIADIGITDIYGIVVRTYPTQNLGSGLAAGFGAVGTNGPVVDVLRSGYIMVPINGSPAKGAPVFIWVAATAAPHVLGGFEAVATGGSTLAIASLKTTYNGAPDSTGIGELAFNI